MTQSNHIPLGYKSSSLGVIPENWRVKRLGEFSTFFSGGTPKSDNVQYYNGSIPFIRSGEISRDKTELFLSQEGFDNSSAKIVEKGDLLYALYGANSGQCSLSKINGAINQAILCIRPNADRYYILSVLQLNKEHYYNSYLQGGQGNLSGEIVSNYKIAVPPIEEQKKIAELLSEWDKAFELQKKLIEKLELRKRALMQRLLTGHVRLNGFSDKWQTQYLRDLFVERNETGNEHLPLLSITAEKGVILQSESDKRDNSNEDKSKYKRICPNDIGYNTMRMWQGRSALSDMEGIVSPAYTIVIPNGNVNPFFIISLIQQPRVVYDFWAHSQGLVDDTLNCKFPNFSQVKVSIPSLAEQTAIAEVLISADKEIEIAKTKLSSFRNQKRGLMQQLLTGKKRV